MENLRLKSKDGSAKVIGSGGARGGPAGALAPPNASYNKLIYTHKPGLEAIFREILHAWPPLMDDYHVWPPLSIIPASAPDSIHTCHYTI
jgi:hypothetical protein